MRGSISRRLDVTFVTEIEGAICDSTISLIPLAKV
jgi:hypothetical protein